MRLLFVGISAVVVMGSLHRPEARSASLCSIVESGKGPQLGTVEYTERLVRDAEIIARARALRAGDGDHAVAPSKAG